MANFRLPTVVCVPPLKEHCFRRRKQGQTCCSAGDGIPTHRPKKICDVLIWCKGSDCVLGSKQNNSPSKDMNSLPPGYDEAAAIGAHRASW